MIEVRGLTKNFGDLRAVDGISFAVDRGEILGFLGPNGAGKTTTMRIIAGFIPASHGSVTVDGYDIFRNELAVKRRIGYLPESSLLYNDMTVESFLRFVAEIKDVPRKAIATEIGRLTAQLALQPVLDRMIANISKGYRQRVAFAQALIGDPPVLILDEPTMGLDPRQIISVREMIKNLAGGHTVLLSTHILPEVSMTCNRVVIINKGRLVAVDTPENLTAYLQGKDTILLEVDGPVEAVVSTIKKIKQVHSVAVSGSKNTGPIIYSIETESGADIRREVAAKVVKNGWGLLGLKREHLTLEDIFMELTTNEEEIG